VAELRRPRDVPDLLTDAGPAPAFTPTLDTDADGVPDTALTDDGVDLVVSTDLDGDGTADQVLRIGPDGVVHRVADPVQVLFGDLGASPD
jgi:hypothetical protein